MYNYCIITFLTEKASDSAVQENCAGGGNHMIPKPLVRNTTKEGGRMVKLT